MIVLLWIVLSLLGTFSLAVIGAVIYERYAAARWLAEHEQQLQERREERSRERAVKKAKRRVNQAKKRKRMRRKRGRW